MVCRVRQTIPGSQLVRQTGRLPGSETKLFENDWDAARATHFTLSAEFCNQPCQPGTMSPKPMIVFQSEGTFIGTRPTHRIFDHVSLVFKELPI